LQINKVKVKSKKDLSDLPEIVDLDTDTATQPEEELDPEVVEALKLKQKKAKKPSHDTDYIPELERGEFDIDSGLNEDY